MDLLLAIIELLSLSARAEALQVNIDWKYPFLKRGRGSVWPKILGTRGRPPPTILRIRKLDELNFHVVRMSTELLFVLSQFTRLTHTRTDVDSKSLPLHVDAC